MEVLRFGSTIPGGYWGCCAGDIIQNCKVDPDAQASISLVDGDGGVFMQKFLGKTFREIFESRLRIGTFSTRDMPNHFFLVVLEANQISGGNGAKWLAILKEHGFEFIRTVNNSVWNKNNYVFGLFRNTGPNAVKDQFTPPQAWLDLPSNGKKELYEFLSTADRKDLTANYAKVDRKVWDKVGPAKLYTQQQLEEAGVPVTLAAIRTPFPPQGPTARAKAIDQFQKGAGEGKQPNTGNTDTTGEVMLKSKATVTTPPATKA
jgi:hypothetical protein